jgi:hypothetical protein
MAARAFAADESSVVLTPAADQTLFRVRMLVELGGHAHIPRNSLVSKDRARQVPIEANSTIDYEERWIRGTGKSSGLITAAHRYYNEAQSKTKVPTGEQVLELRDEARTVIAETNTGRLVLRGVPTPLRHTEADLLELPINSLALDGILPTVAVTQGASWEPAAEAMGRLLNVETVQSSSIKAKLAELTAEQAKIHVQGLIDAAVDGVPTAIELAMKVSFDRQSSAITWCAAAIRERRDIGRAEPGFELSARIRLMREPIRQASLLPEQFKPEDEQSPALIEVYSIDGRYSVLLDPTWRVMSDGGGWTMIRCVERDTVLAQCEIRRLNALTSGQQLTLEGLQNDIRRSLGKSFREYTEAEEKLTSTGLRLLRLVADGDVEGVPVQWIYLHFSDDSGERRSVVYTFQPENYERVLASEAQVIGSLEFLAEAEAPAATLDDSESAEDAEEAGSTPSAEQARLADEPDPR